MVDGVKCSTQIKKYQQCHILMIDVDADIIRHFNKHHLCAMIFFFLVIIVSDYRKKNI